MTGRNLRLLTILIILGIACAIQASRMKYVSDIALAMDYLDQLYIEPIDRQELANQAMTGMLGNLDSNTGFIPPTNLDQFKNRLEQNFAGLGVVIQKSDSGELLVVRTIHDAPADKAGVMSDDRIVAIDNVLTEGLSIDQASKMLRGQPNTMVTLSIMRDGNASALDVEVVRAMVQSPSTWGDRRDTAGNVVHWMQADPRIAYIHMSVFGEHSAQEMREFFIAHRDKARAYVIDLRNNGGGLLYTAKDICSMFLDPGKVIVTTRGRDNKTIEVVIAEGGKVVPEDIPVVILLNQNSASASEVTAGCLRDHGRAVLAGQRSYGKGSVQDLIEMDGGRSALKLTTALWYPPSGENVHRNHNDESQTRWGLDPLDELRVEINESQYEQAVTRLYRRETGKLEAQSAELAKQAPSNPESQDLPTEKDPIVDDANLAGLLAADESLRDDIQLLKVLAWLQPRLK